MKIVVSDAFDTAEIKEDQKTEFKTSIFVDPMTQKPGFRQMMTIADTLAAFMNAEGGMLYVGIGDDKSIHGIEDDLRVLAGQSADVALRSARGNDESFTYGGTNDKYELKIRAIVKACLSANASEYLGAVNFAKMGSKTVCRIEAKPCRPDDYVYAYCKYGPGKPEVAEIFRRFGNQKRKLEGAERDDFIKQRYGHSLLARMTTMRTVDPKVSTDALLDGIRGMLAEKVITGAAVTVTGAVPLEEKTLTPIGKPKGVVFDGEHLCDVKSWKDVFLAIYRKLNELNPQIFDSLPDDAALGKWFKRGKRCPKCYSDRFGTKGDVRAVELSGKAYLWNENYFFRKMLKKSGFDTARFMIRA